MKTKTTGNFLYAIAILLIIVWAIGILGFQAVGVIHILLLTAVIAVLLKNINESKTI